MKSTPPIISSIGINILGISLSPSDKLKMLIGYLIIINGKFINK